VPGQGVGNEIEVLNRAHISATQNREIRDLRRHHAALEKAAAEPAIRVVFDKKNFSRRKTKRKVK
jgi:hypothetical protein